MHVHEMQEEELLNRVFSLHT